MVKDQADKPEGIDTLRLTLQVAPCALLVVEASGAISMANHEAERLFGYDAGELIGKNIEDLVPEHLRDRHKQQREQFAAKPSGRPMGQRRDLSGRRRDGTTVPVEIGLSPINLPQGGLTLAAVVDLTERKAAEQKIAAQARELEEANKRLARMASTDSLTALWNRRSFLDQLGVQMELALRNERPLSMLLLDIDNFKPYNDDYGHLAGDEVLQLVARTLQEVARRSDYVARIGGEEFAVILPETDSKGAVQLAERFRAAVANVDWPLRPTTVSIGATTVHLTHSEPRPRTPFYSKILGDADHALYHAKEHGRNRVIHSNELASLGH